MTALGVVGRTVPLLTVDGVVPVELCARLVEHAAAIGWTPSPSHTADADGGLLMRIDPARKVRDDVVLVASPVLDEVVVALQARLLPEIDRCLAHRPTSFEAPKVVRYPSGTGHFAPHRDNLGPDVAHRRLAVTINLTDGHEGGELRFPELGPQRYRPPVGAAIVFSCGLLHEVTAVIAGDRHALVTFLW